MILVRTTVLAVALIAASLSAFAVAAAEPVKRIAIFVQPYYDSARYPDRPRVAVGEAYSTRLSSARREDILAVRDEIVAAPATVTPMTMMVLAIRLYDIGERDEAVKWFYIAKERFIVFSDVVDVTIDGLAGPAAAVADFARLAGPTINGYAFCDLAKQQAAHAAALDWIAQNPYAPMFMERLPAKAPDRRESLARALADARTRFAKERAHFADAKTAAEFYATRKANGMDEKFCWK